MKSIISWNCTNHLHYFSAKNSKIKGLRKTIYEKSIISWNCPSKIIYIFASWYIYLEDNTDKWNCQSFYLYWWWDPPRGAWQHRGPKKSLNFTPCILVHNTSPDWNSGYSNEYLPHSLWTIWRILTRYTCMFLIPFFRCGSIWRTRLC